MFNRLANVHNHYQRIEQHPRALCVCSAGLLRSPTAAVVLAQEPFNFNTRAAGVASEYALVPVDEALLEWADLIVCMSGEHADYVSRKQQEDDAPIFTLGLPDAFEYRDSKLIELIKEKALELGLDKFKDPNLK